MREARMRLQLATALGPAGKVALMLAGIFEAALWASLVLAAPAAPIANPAPLLDGLHGSRGRGSAARR